MMGGLGTRSRPQSLLVFWFWHCLFVYGSVYRSFKKVLIMAAIAEISSLQEWEEEWKALEEDTKKFKVLILYLK